MGSSFDRGRTLSPRAVDEAHRWRVQRVAVLQKRFDDNPLSLTFKERHELRRLGGRAVVGLPEEESRSTVVKKKPEAPKVEKVPPEARRVHTLRRKAAIKPAVEDRKERQKKSQQRLRKSIVKPTLGHMSPRPGRHSGKLTKRLRSTDAK